VIGSRLGPYEVTAKLGEGGMGEVYRATDTKLHRDVAIKVLPEAFTEDKERLQRFEREAQLLAQLQHPNIASIYGLEESGSTRALVMELVEGPTLADRLEQGSLSIDESLSVARQIAEALEEAHEKGIVHRDLKPQNIKASLAGKVKVLDFGLAKAMDPVGTASGAPSASQLAASPTLTLGATVQGVILGTAAYMAPEQARGMPVDKRADIWAFGVVLWEMLAGETLFAAETVTDTLADVLRRKIDLDRLPAETPAAVRRLVARCLERNPKERLRDIGEARIALEHPGEPAPRSADGAAAPRTSAWRRFLPWGVAAAGLGLALLSSIAGRESGTPTTRAASSLVAFGVRLPEGLVLAGRDVPVMDLSRDGRTLVFVGDGEDGQKLYRRSFDRVGIEVIQGTEGAADPFLSPDARWVGFYAGGRVRKVALEGGSPVVLATVNADRGATWTDRGWIVFTDSYTGGLFRVREAGGSSEPLTELDPKRSERTHRWPTQIPGTPWVLFSVGISASPSFYDDARIEAVNLDTRERHTVYEGAWMARYAPPDHLLLQRRGSLVELGFDPAAARAEGQERLVLEGVGGEASSGAGYFAAGAGEALAYVPAEALTDEKAVALVAPGGEEKLLPLPARNYWYPRFSPDGRRLAIDIGSGQGTDDDIWLYELGTERFSRFSFTRPSVHPAWTPDGRWIAYGGAGPSRASTLFRKRSDGTGAEEKIWTGNDVVLPIDWTIDGGAVAVTNTIGELDAYLVTLGSGEARELAPAPGSTWGTDFSPDGRYMAYTSNESGRAEVIVSTFPEGDGKWQVSVDGGMAPVWSRDGSRLYFIKDDATWSLDVETEPTFRAGTPVEVLRGPYILNTAPFRNYDVGPDGRFVFVRRRTDVQAPRQLEVLVGWTSKLPEGSVR